METVIYTSNINGQPLRNKLKVVLLASEKTVGGTQTRHLEAPFESGIFKTSDPEMIKLMDNFPRYGWEYCRLEEVPMGNIPSPDPTAIPPGAREPESSVLKPDVGDRGKEVLGALVQAPELPPIDPDPTAGQRTQVIPNKAPGAGAETLVDMDMGQLNHIAKELGLNVQIRKGRTKAIVIQEIEAARSK